LRKYASLELRRRGIFKEIKLFELYRNDISIKPQTNKNPELPPRVFI